MKRLNKKLGQLSPSEFYRTIRPEFFSDSELQNETVISEEHFMFILDRITQNQKENEFEILCRKLAERFITPNLIPQVGPTGGGDGKVDIETYPVSEEISMRWFTSCWSSTDKWAFAISAKKAWKAKLESDVKKIVNTARNYNKIFFMTNQAPSSKQKKDIEDALSKKYEIEIKILDGVWIREKVFTDSLFELVIKTLNLNSISIEQNKIVGINDSERQKDIERLESRIKDGSGYFENDFMLFEDCLEVAILSRMLEKSRDEVEGKFLRVIRIAERIKSDSLTIKVKYQRAWTYLYYYDDIEYFIKDYTDVKKLMNSGSKLEEIEKYITLYISLVGLDVTKRESSLVDKEMNDILGFLEIIQVDPAMPNRAAFAKTNILMIQIYHSIAKGHDPTTFIKELNVTMGDAQHLMEYPFLSIKEMLGHIGSALPNNCAMDDLFDNIIPIIAKRQSDVEAGNLLLKRGEQKLNARLYSPAVKYIGKATVLYAKEESQNELAVASAMLGIAYRGLGLDWASNNAFLTSFTVLFKQFTKENVPSLALLVSLQELMINEIAIGRLTVFLRWFELYAILQRYREETLSIDGLSSFEYFDTILMIRLLNTAYPILEKHSHLPEIFKKYGLFLSADSILYRYGYDDEIRKDVLSVADIDEFFAQASTHPMKHKMRFNTNFISETSVTFQSCILGCIISVTSDNNDSSLLFTETLLAFFESLLSTSTSGVTSHIKSVNIILNDSPEQELYKLERDIGSNTFNLKMNLSLIDQSNLDFIWECLLKLAVEIISHVFFIPDIEKYFKNLFQDEEVHKRLSIVLSHKINTTAILGSRFKLKYQDWIEGIAIIEPIRETKIKEISASNEGKYKEYCEQIDIYDVPHDLRQVQTCINKELWDHAHWEAVSYMFFEGKSIVGIVFKNQKYADLILEEWSKEIANSPEGFIKISIVTEINKEHPYNYLVIIHPPIDTIKMNSSSIVVIVSRQQEMTPKTSNNLLTFKNIVEQTKNCYVITFSMDEIKSNIPESRMSIKLKQAIKLHCIEIKSFDSLDKSKDAFLYETVNNYINK